MIVLSLFMTLSINYMIVLNLFMTFYWILMPLCLCFNCKCFEPVHDHSYGSYAFVSIASVESICMLWITYDPNYETSIPLWPQSYFGSWPRYIVAGTN